MFSFTKIIRLYKIFTTGFALFFILTSLKGQKLGEGEFDRYEIEKVTDGDFAIPDSVYEKEDGAIYLYRLGRAKLDFGVNLEVICDYTIQERILVLNDNGKEMADQVISLFKGNDNEKSISHVKGKVYNLTNGKIEVTKLKNADWQVEDYNDELNLVRFTFKNVKAGSIIELEYTIHDPFWFGLDDWEIQLDSPVLHSQFQISYPANFGYKILKMGNHPLHQSQSFTKRVALGAGAAVNSYEEVNYLFSAKNIPALRPEPIMDSPENYRARIMAELHYIDPVGTGDRNFFYNNWEASVDDYYDEGTNRRFYDVRSKKQLVDVENPKSYTQEGLIVAIYKAVQSRLSSNGSNGGIVMSRKPKDFLFTKQASDCEINMFMIAALRQNGVDAFPLLYSLRKYERVLTEFPIFTQFNSLMAIVYVGDGYMLLDASNPSLQPGEISEKSYNGEGLAAEIKNPRWYPMKGINPTYRRSTVDLRELKEDSVLGKMRISLSGLYAYRVKQFLLKNNAEKLETYFSLADGVSLTYDGNEMDKAKGELYINFTIKVALEEYGDSYIFPAVLVEPLTDNPFDKEERKYPIVYPDNWEEKYTCILRLDPEKFDIEVPESKNLILPGKDAEFSFSSSYNFGNLIVRSGVTMNKNRFLQNAYESLRTFYDQVAEAHGEYVEVQKL
ncbi:MAG: DUF3857 domain-containing protein [Flavobacteriales bacterium]|nr:DUF3857 domain-containing protein [Flavobacteriales bacterium]